jgi:hypothetical protein
MTWVMKTTGSNYLSNLSLFLSNSKNCLDLNMCLLQSLPNTCMHATIEELLEEVFFFGSALRLYKEI